MRWTEEWKPVLALTCGCIAMLCVPLLFNWSFYFTDDNVSYFSPMFVEISRQLGEGVFPLSTSRLWSGGAIAAEYQFAIFNPVSLLLMFVYGHFTDLGAASAFFMIVHYVIFCLGTFVLARQIGFGTEASVVTAVLGISSGWLLYFGATSWVPAVTSISWAPWCLAALHLVYRDPRWLPLGSVATAMPILCGWPFTTVSLALMIGVALICGLFARLSFARLSCVALAAALGLGLCAPAILPTAVFMQESRRLAQQTLWSVDIASLLSVGNPMFMTHWRGWWAERQFVVTPILYLAWFVPLVLAAFLRRVAASPLAVGLVVSVLAFALLSQTQYAWYLRWAMRFLPFYHFTLALLVGWCLAQRVQERWRALPTAIVIGVSFSLAMWAESTYWEMHLISLAALLTLSRLVMIRQSDGKGISGVLLVSHLAIYVWLIARNPYNDAWPQWAPPTAPPVAASSDTLQLTLFDPLKAGAFPAGYWDEIQIGNRSLLAGHRSINGYSPILPRGTTDAFQFNSLGHRRDSDAAQLFRPDDKTGLSLLDLVRLDSVVAEKGVISDSFAKASAGLWTRDPAGQLSDRYTRASALPALPGTVSWMSGALDLRAVSWGERSEVFDLATPAAQDTEVLLARAWYPGYGATLDGRPLDVSGYRFLVPLVTVPKGGAGRLVVEYWPAGLTPGLQIAGAIAFFLLLWATLSSGWARVHRRMPIPLPYRPISGDA